MLMTPLPRTDGCDMYIGYLHARVIKSEASGQGRGVSVIRVHVVFSTSIPRTSSSSSLSENRATVRIFTSSRVERLQFYLPKNYQGIFVVSKKELYARSLTFHAVLSSNYWTIVSVSSVQREENG